MQRLARLISRFRRDERGVFLPIFAILAIVLIATSGAVVDFTMTQQARTRAQTALDAATLALQSELGKPGVTAATLKEKAQTILTERLNDASITATVTSATPEPNAGRLNIQAFIVVPTAFVQLVGITEIRANLQSEVQRASSDLEVSLALDVTQSMSGSKITALIGSTNKLIDLIVQDVQTPTYSKMALAPYSNAVNVGTKYANLARGTPTPAVAISSVTGTSGSIFTIKSITKANPAVVETTANHGLKKDDYIYIGNVTGMTDIEAGIYRVGTLDGTKKFNLLKSNGTNVNSSSYKNYTQNSGRLIKCSTSTCKITVTTSANHNLANNDYVYITGSAASGLNDLAWQVTEKTNTTFVPSGATPLVGNGNGGNSWCTKYGCTYRRYQNIDGGYPVSKANTCVTERTTTTHAADDTNPTDAPLGFHYPNASGSACITTEIQPLTTNKTDLHTLTNKLKVSGSTAGHIGLAWAWYMISPDFVSKNIAAAGAWPTDSKPAAFGKKNLVKAVILMTDGIFNTFFEQGVPARDSDPLSGNNSVRSTTKSPIGNSIDQAKAICTEIKKPEHETLLYTVGFDIGSNSAEDTNARAFLEECASPGGYFYQADDAADLDNAFTAIAGSLSELRLSK